MKLKPLLLLVLVCIGCQTGRIPCPKIKSVRLQSSNTRRAFAPELSARAEEVKEIPGKNGRSSIRYTKNVNIEEWDCPQPGSRKFMPRNIRNNIRRNAELINEEKKKLPADSVTLQR